MGTPADVTAPPVKAVTRSLSEALVKSTTVSDPFRVPVASKTIVSAPPSLPSRCGPASRLKLPTSGPVPLFSATETTSLAFTPGAKLSSSEPVIGL